MKFCMVLGMLAGLGLAALLIFVFPHESGSATANPAADLANFVLKSVGIEKVSKSTLAILSYVIPGILGSSGSVMFYFAAKVLGLGIANRTTT